MTAYVVLKLAYATSRDLALGSDPQRAFPRLPPPPFVFQRQSDAVERASVLAARLLSYEAATVEFIVLETKQAFRATSELHPIPALIGPQKKSQQAPPAKAEGSPPPLPVAEEADTPPKGSPQAPPAKAERASPPPLPVADESDHEDEDETNLADALMLALKDDD